MTEWTLTLFGQPNLRQDGQDVELTSRKGWALLAYLASHDQPIPREQIALLFWPEHEAAAARRNLRRLLYTLNQSPVAPFVQTEGETVALQWSGEIDVRMFVAAIEAEDWQTAVTHYQDPFLAGMDMPDSDLFETWLAEQRAQLRQQMLQALLALTDVSMVAGDGAQAEATVRQWLGLDSWNEAAWRRLMTILAQNGRRAQALAEYHNCRQLLQAELAVAPAAETTALFEAIRDGRLGQQTDGRYAIPPPAPVPHPAARQALLDKVQSYWIDSVLHQSLHGQALVQMDKTRQPEALVYPWTTLLQRPSQSPQPIAAHTPIANLFDSEGRALLILGAPGSGKTTMLLDLAQQMLGRARADVAQPSPVVLNLASWRGQPLEDWVVAEMKEKYLLPTAVVQAWLAGHHLLLLCDGLDELATDLQADCVTAVNQFRQTHGLTSMAVCSRQADYEALATPLNLHSAIVLQPLTLKQVDGYLGQWGQQLTALRQLLSTEKALQKLAQSPLLLSIMALVFQGMSRHQLELMGAAKGEPKHLFVVYVQQMLARRGENGRFSPAQLQTSLHWLASQLTLRHQAIFLLERLQPDWLGSQWLIALYFVLSRFVGGFVLGTAWSFRDNGTTAVAFGLFFGLVVAGTELVLWRLDSLNLPYRRLWRSVVMATAVALFTISSGWVALVNGLIFGLFFGWRQPSHRTDDDIRLVEKLAWSWRSFGKGVGWGLLLGLMVFFYNRQELYAAGTSLLSVVVLLGAFFGWQGRAITAKTRPNEGMYLSWRNAWSGGLVVGGAMFLVALLIEFSRGVPSLLPLWVGVQYGVMAGLWYGGLDLIQHYVLRVLLAWNGRLPWQAVSFLEQAGHLIFLYRVGSGYMFVHPLLQAHFAEMDVGEGLEKQPFLHADVWQKVLR